MIPSGKAHNEMILGHEAVDVGAAIGADGRGLV
jgi:hypothetical protein